MVFQCPLCERSDFEKVRSGCVGNEQQIKYLVKEGVTCHGGYTPPVEEVEGLSMHLSLHSGWLRHCPDHLWGPHSVRSRWGHVGEDILQEISASPLWSLHVFFPSKEVLSFPLLVLNPTSLSPSCNSGSDHDPRSLLGGFAAGGMAVPRPPAMLFFFGRASGSSS